MQPSPLNTLAFHLKRLLTAAGPEREHHRRKIAETIGLLLADTAATRDELALQKRLSGLALAIEEDRLPADYELVLRDLERCLHSQPKEGVRPASPSPIEQVAVLLRGRALLVVGGVPKPEHKERLRERFGLGEVVWPKSNEHAPDGAALEPQIARADVAAVVLLIRFVRHATNDAVREMCRRYGKPLVSATHGYNVNQVADQVLKQISSQLDGRS